MTTQRVFHVYIMTNRSRTLYTGFTGDLMRRVLEHREGRGGHYTSLYKTTRLVHVEETASSLDAIAREKQIKGWSRARKLALIEAHNPDWVDLAEEWFGPTL